MHLQFFEIFSVLSVPYSPKNIVSPIIGQYLEPGWKVQIHYAEFLRQPSTH